MYQEILHQMIDICQVNTCEPVCYIMEGSITDHFYHAWIQWDIVLGSVLEGGVVCVALWVFLLSAWGYGCMRSLASL